MKSEDILDYRRLIEEDLDWRLDEVAFFNNQLNSFKLLNLGERELKRVELEKNKYRKSLVLILYSHFEGFFRYSFEVYAEALNQEKIKINEAIDVLVVSCLNKEFSTYDESSKWIRPNDGSISNVNLRFSNRLDLLKKIEGLKNGNIELNISNFRDKNSVTYTESNLNVEVIDKILYRLGIHRTLGLDQREFAKLMGLVSQFVKKRNGIAHGDINFKDGVTGKDFMSYKKVFDRIVNLIPIVITNALKKQVYLKPANRT